MRAVAALASGFAGEFDAAAWGRLAGLWHDLGKYHPAFQRRIRGARETVEHSGVGAVLASDLRLTPLAFVIAGHHAGLANPITPGTVTPLVERLATNRQLLQEVRALIPPPLLAADPLPGLPPWLKRGAGMSAEVRDQVMRSTEFWVRMLFSALVDADRLATERFLAPERAALRLGTGDLAPLLQRLTEYLAGLQPDTEVRRGRREVLEACVAAAMRPPGAFSLTVPTGGGKTFSSLAFALRHAVHHGLRRVVVAIPFTSIIEQNAAAYRRVLGDGQVLEHHSNLDEPALAEANAEPEAARRLATEDWDSPVIVTTNVQLFESLFSNRPSRCRRLHNLVRSVIILDEAQAMPAGFLLPALDALNELISHYGCTVLLCTATQPALARRAAFPHGLEGVREIVPDPVALANRLARVRVEWPDVTQPPMTYETLAREVAEHPQVLVIVHRRSDARELASLLPQEGRFHLSALMCPAHRTEVLTRLRKSLNAGETCRLVSTQVVEAGVDIDFPVVYRAMAGLDSLVQAAGRCNREGRLTDAAGAAVLGRFVIFQAPTLPPPGILRRGLETTDSMRARHPGGVDLGSPKVTEQYFRLLYGAVPLDVKNVQRERSGLNFAATAESFHLIPDATTPVVVPYGDALDRLQRLAEGTSREAWRALQPFTVQVYDQMLREMLRVGAVAEVSKGLFRLTRQFEHLYTPELGLGGGQDLFPDPEALIA